MIKIAKDLNRLELEAHQTTISMRLKCKIRSELNGQNKLLSSTN
jgi:hypothetical protein